MARRLRLTPEEIINIQQELMSQLANVDCFDGKLSLTYQITEQLEQTTILNFSSQAYLKMLTIVLRSNVQESAWFGVVSRNPENPQEFLVEDILVFPQLVNGAKVDVEQKPFDDWVASVEDETYVKLRMQGHTHVNMNAFFSDIDKKYYRQSLDNIQNEGQGQLFQIYAVWNRKLEHEITIIDFENNLVYEDKDIKVTVDGSAASMDEFWNASKELIQTKPKSIGFTAPTASVHKKQSKADKTKKAEAQSYFNDTLVLDPLEETVWDYYDTGYFAYGD